MARFCSLAAVAEFPYYHLCTISFFKSRCAVLIYLLKNSLPITSFFLLTAYYSQTSRNGYSGVVDSGVRRMSEVNARRPRLVPGWMTVFGRVYHLSM